MGLCTLCPSGLFIAKAPDDIKYVLWDSGINFFSNKAVQLQLEIAYDGSTVTYQAPDYYGGGNLKEIEPGGLLASVRAAF